MNLVILVGPPGAYVDECARGLAELRGWEYACVNDALESVEGRSLDSIVEEEGAEYFSRMEVGIARAFLETMNADEHRVFALGSGSMGQSMTSERGSAVRSHLLRLKNAGAHIVYMSASLATLARRNGLDGPRFASVISPRAILYTHLAARQALYMACASAHIDTDKRSLEDLVHEIHKATL